MKRYLIVVAALAPGLPASSQLAVGYGGATASYLWTSSSRVRSGDTLRIRAVEFNTSPDTIRSTLDCDASLSTELLLDPVSDRCNFTQDLLAPGDSTWAAFDAIVLSPPGSYQLSLEIGRHGRQSHVEVLPDTMPEGTVLGLPPRRLPFVLSTAGSQPDRFDRSELEVLIGRALRLGAGIINVMTFPVSEEASMRFAASGPLLEIQLTFEADGTVVLERCWRGQVSDWLARLCGRASRSGSRSDLLAGANLQRLFEREGKYFTQSRR